MKSVKRVASLFMAVAMFVVLCCPAQAKTTVQSPTSGRYYRISYAKNGRYLDIPSEGYKNNGTQLQIWDYAKQHQNQVFRLDFTASGWHIVSQEGRYVTVQNAGHDNYTPVVQEAPMEGLKCALWNVRQNADGTVSFKNVESGKYLNVRGGGDAQNGTKIIQYKDDDTIAMRFYLEEMSDSDIVSAKFTRNVLNSELSWTLASTYNIEITNKTGWSKWVGNYRYYPTPRQKLLYSVEFLSPDTVAEMVWLHSEQPTLLGMFQN